ncbi:hypothetical protein Tco_0363669 [Tanacetum coccineum]
MQSPVIKFDVKCSIQEKVFAIAALKNELRKLKAPKLLKNKDAHIDYIKQSKDHVDTLREIVKNARALSWLDSNLDSACIPKLKYQKDHLCSAYALGKSKKHFNKPKAEDSIQEKLYLLHMDLCGPMRIQTSFNSASPVVKSFVNSSEMLENQENNKSKSDKGYHAVPPPFTGNFMPRKTNLTFMDEIVKSENLDVTTVVTPSNVKTVNSNLESAGVKNNGDVVEPKTVRKNSFRLSVIEDWNSGDKVSFEHLHYVCDKKVIRPVVEQLKKGESKNFAK